MKSIYLINALFGVAIALCICSLLVLHVTLYIPILFSSILLSPPELLWVFAIVNFSLWVVYKLVNRQLLSDKITRLQIVTTFVATLSFCSIEWWGRFFIGGRRYVEISKSSMVSNLVLFREITTTITIIFLASLFLLLLNVAIGFYKKIRV